MALTTEYEAKALDIDIEAIQATIRHRGGEHVADRMMRRYVYDIAPGDTSKWIRLRQDGDQATLCVKQITSDEIDGTHEVEVTVSSFEDTHALLRVMGFTAKAYQENHRSSYLLGTVRLEIDSWPLIPPYLEIEGDSADEVRDTAKHLGLDPDALTSVNTTGIYTHYGHDLTAIKELRFPS
ncbi:class IV adenylate cyclase [Streptomyces sulphureus]|uniref:class IV adenylate cyclase n=1 Tax=Streptomyces sulphureus TaxID=47758 RepID=UPI00037BEA12|nr:CYTH domain-containing protein [Streptomyces sulphureus]